MDRGFTRQVLQEVVSGQFKRAFTIEDDTKTIGTKIAWAWATVIADTVGDFALCTAPGKWDLALCRKSADRVFARILPVASSSERVSSEWTQAAAAIKLVLSHDALWQSLLQLSLEIVSDFGHSVDGMRERESSWCRLFCKSLCEPLQVRSWIATLVFIRQCIELMKTPQIAFPSLLRQHILPSLSLFVQHYEVLVHGAIVRGNCLRYNDELALHVHKVCCRVFGDLTARAFRSELVSTSDAAIHLPATSDSISEEEKSRTVLASLCLSWTLEMPAHSHSSCQHLSTLTSRPDDATIRVRASSYCFAPGNFFWAAQLTSRAVLHFLRGSTASSSSSSFSKSVNQSANDDLWLRLMSMDVKSEPHFFSKAVGKDPTMHSVGVACVGYGNTQVYSLLSYVAHLYSESHPTTFRPVAAATVPSSTPPLSNLSLPKSPVFSLVSPTKPKRSIAARPRGVAPPRDPRAGSMLGGGVSERRVHGVSQIRELKNVESQSLERRGHGASQSPERRGHGASQSPDSERTETDCSESEGEEDDVKGIDDEDGDHSERENQDMDESDDETDSVCSSASETRKSEDIQIREEDEGSDPDSDSEVTSNASSCRPRPESEIKHVAEIFFKALDGCGTELKTETKKGYLSGVRTCMRSGSTPDQIAQSNYVKLKGLERNQRAIIAGIKWFARLYERDIKPFL